MRGEKNRGNFITKRFLPDYFTAFFQDRSDAIEVAGISSWNASALKTRYSSAKLENLCPSFALDPFSTRRMLTVLFFIQCKSRAYQVVVW